jgi:cytochrome c2
MTLSPADVVIGVLYLVTLSGLVLYGANAWVMVLLHWRHRTVPRPAPAPPDPLPVVTVQLPLFNERYVAERLLTAAAALEYPRDRLEIQVLDDSTDVTSDIVARVVARLRASGLDVVHRRRAARTGYKAGALAEGLTVCRGEFVAVFDADFVPPADFLLRTLPHFAPDVAVVQTRWGHLNRDYSALTVAQALGMDGHFGVEQSARAWSGLCLNFNGTAGVWRRTAIVDAGGWQPDTLTEDLDLSYRAQLRGWRIVYRPEIVCPAELPVVVTGFKSQQRRWAKGSIQTARKLLPAVFASSLPPWTKYQAFVHLTYYMIHPLMLAGIALLLPARALVALDPGGVAKLAGFVVFGLATLGPTTLLVYAQCVLGPGAWRRLAQLPAIMIFGVGVSLSTSLAVLGAFRSRPHREFVRTPKFGIDVGSRRWQGKAYGDRGIGGGVAELGLGAFCAAVAWLFWRDGEYAALPFLALYALGFTTVGGLTIAQSVRLARPPRWRRGVPALITRRTGQTLTLLALCGVIAVALAVSGPRGADDVDRRATDRWAALVAEGEARWTQSPDRANPVACATCHHDPMATRAWAASFPKFKPQPPPHARVMTLLQANAQAVTRHYRDLEPRRAAAAITAYLTAHGAPQPASPGIAEGQPVFEHRLAALADSADRGRRQYVERCANCHDAASVSRATGDLPGLIRRRGGPVEMFLEQHHVAGPRLAWDSADMADLMAFLARLRAGRSLTADGTDAAQ